MAEDDVTAETKPNGGAVKRPAGAPLNPPHPRRSKSEVLGVEIGAEITDDGTLPLKTAAGAITSCRETWRGACTLHAQLMGKVSPLTPEPAQQIRSRAWFFASKQRSLRAADAALAEIRTEQKTVDEKIARATVPPIARENFAGAVLASEIRSFLRSLNDAERLSTLERAIAGNNVEVMGAASSVPVLAGLDQTRADMLLGRWRKVRCPQELERLAVLQATAQKVTAAAERLETKVSGRLRPRRARRPGSPAGQRRGLIHGVSLPQRHGCDRSGAGRAGRQGRRRGQLG